jgi:hypothetical protein
MPALKTKRPYCKGCAYPELPHTRVPPKSSPAYGLSLKKAISFGLEEEFIKSPRARSPSRTKSRSRSQSRPKSRSRSRSRSQSRPRSPKRRTPRKRSTGLSGWNRLVREIQRQRKELGSNKSLLGDAMKEGKRIKPQFDKTFGKCKGCSIKPGELQDFVSQHIKA